LVDDETEETERQWRGTRGNGADRGARSHINRDDPAGRGPRAEVACRAVADRGINGQAVGVHFAVENSKLRISLGNRLR